jgi:ATP-binding cassette subfamily F protein uup
MSRAIWRTFCSLRRAHSRIRSHRQRCGATAAGRPLFARPANVLVLDEPTNDLDIETLDMLEDLLQSYDGTVFLVSHDRTFLDNVVTSTIAWEGPATGVNTKVA